MVSPVRQYWDFEGWYLDSACSDEKRVTVLNSDSYTEDVTLYAKWSEHEKYNIKFNKNSDSAIGTQTSITDVYVDDASTLPDCSFSRKGYLFNGWNTQSDGLGTQYSSNTNVSVTTEQTLELFAQWKPITYSVSFDGNLSSSGSTTAMNFTYDESQNLTANGFARTGYTFDGWNTKSDGSGTSYSNSQSVSNLSASQNGAVTLYAKWKANSFTVTFDKNNSSATGTMSNESFTYDTSKNLTANGFAKTGYTFDGWNTKSDGSGTSYSNSQSVKNLTASENGSVTLYAKWKANTFTVVFNKNNNSATGTMSNESFTYDTSKKLSSNGFSLSKYHFDSWNTQADGKGTKYTAGESVKNLTSTSGGTVNLYAIWAINTYTVKFNGNSSTSGSMNSQTFTATESKTLTSNGFSRTNYAFLGWSKTSGGSVAYTNAQSVSGLSSTNGDTINLYAVWEQCKGTTSNHTWVRLWKGGTKWAEFNLGATISSYEDKDSYSTSNVGDYYAYAALKAMDRNTSNYSVNILHRADRDVAYKLWGSDWGMPSLTQWQALKDNCDWTWCDGSTKKYASGCTLAGYKVSGKGAYSGFSIFLPAAGCYNNPENDSSKIVNRSEVGDSCGFWSTSWKEYVNNHNYSYSIYLTKDSLRINDGYREYVDHFLSIRPIVW